MTFSISGKDIIHRVSINPKIIPRKSNNKKIPFIRPRNFKLPLSVEKSPEIVKIASISGTIENP